MLLTLVITLLLIGAAVIGSLYSGFLTFYNNFSETENYNKAYYASIAALERAELVVKQREPGYVGSGGWKSSLEDGELKRQSHGANDASDGLISSGFSYLISGNSKGTDVFWTINSRAKRIPATGLGNVDWTLSTGDSIDYNIMDYENAEIFLLYYDTSDTSTKTPYTSVSCPSNCTKSNLTKITGKIRLPQKLYTYPGFGNLDVNKAIIGSIKSDAIVDRQLRGLYNNSSFSIFSTQDIKNTSSNTSRSNQIGSQDSVIRENVINDGVDLEFSQLYKSPIKKAASITTMTVISPDESVIKGLNFRDIFNISNNAFTMLQLRFALLNILGTESKMVYPYLEYYLDFGGAEVSDRYFTMNAEGKYGDYQVNLIVQKPTIKESILGSFTTIF